MRLRDWDYGKANPDRIAVYRTSTMWKVWRGLDWLRDFHTYEDAINFATEEARFEHFWRDWYSKTPPTTREKARNYWDFFMTKGERNAW